MLTGSARARTYRRCKRAFASVHSSDDETGFAAKTANGTVRRYCGRIKAYSPHSGLPYSNPAGDTACPHYETNAVASPSSSGQDLDVQILRSISVIFTLSCLIAYKAFLHQQSPDNFRGSKICINKKCRNIF